MKRIWKLADIGAFILAAVSKKLLCTLNRLLIRSELCFGIYRIIDCYLRLATNYVPPEKCVSSLASETTYPACSPDYSNSIVSLRFEWDWKGVERELRRANEIQTNYPSSHQWYAAYKTTQQLYEELYLVRQDPNALKNGSKVPIERTHFRSIRLT